ncbi:nitrilase-related carbon-nitrogen hydrolase [Georgenia thermotolerans]|uniref:Hydrolase n=1 Tax=Georgenia thermotolerans TaxID=527326 RepID=A0A7J5UR51_9MICO|nr:nitrilase-related carbon-nitrogen hydrolase [Georgenia thermotolerans]KAE8764922.1 hydrolase [Georgenia thermotolerans]
MKVLTAQAPPSPARVHPSPARPVRVGAVQTRWHPDPAEHRAVLRDGVLAAADAGAQVVFLQELTLSRYLADTRPAGPADATAEPLEGGPTHRFAAEAAAAAGVPVHASLFERAPGPDGRGYNTAILVAPDGALLAATRKLHIPVTAGYHEDAYFRPGPAEPEPYPVVALDTPAGRVALGLPTCWDQWFPEVARAYGLAGADVIAYPTAIGTEPDHPAFDTQPLWQHTIVAHGITNGTFMVAVNRWGDEGLNTFYGSSFVSDPYGRVLVQAPRDADAVLVAELDLAQRRDWLDLFPLVATRRPDTYGRLADTSGAGERPAAVGGVPGGA